MANRVCSAHILPEPYGSLYFPKILDRRLIDISNQNELTLLFIITDQKKYLTQKTKKNKEGISLYDKKFIHVNYVTRRKPGIS